MMSEARASLAWGATVAVLAGSMLLAASSTAVQAQNPPVPAVGPPSAAGAGFYSVEQAARGREDFVEICGECHSSSEFRGDDFEWDWRRQTVWDFYRQLTETMPEDMPGFLPDQTYADIIAYILQINAYASGESELTAEEAVMDSIPLGPGVKKQPSQDGAR